MGYHSGRFAVINNVPAMISWDIEDDSDTKEVINSQTFAMPTQLPGVNHWSGSIEQNGAEPVAGLMPGSVFAFTGYTAPDNDTAGGTGSIYSGNIMVERMSLALNWETGDVEKISYEFQGVLGLTFASGQAAIFDTSTPNYYGSKSLPQPKITVANATSSWVPGALTNWPYVTQLTLTISNEIQAVVNASTGGLTDRKAGPWKLEISVVEQEILRSLFDRDNILELQIPTKPDFSRYWDIKWLHVKNFTNIQFNRETGAITSRNISLPFRAWDNEATPVLGKIVLPPGTGTDWWPSNAGGA